MATDTNALYREILYGKQPTETEKALLAMMQALGDEDPGLFTPEEKEELFNPQVSEEYKVDALGAQVDGRVFTTDVDDILTRFKETRQARHDAAVAYYEEAWEKAKEVFKVPQDTFNLVIVFCKALIELQDEEQITQKHRLNCVDFDELSREDAIEFAKESEAIEQEYAKRAFDAQVLLAALLGINAEIFSLTTDELGELVDAKDPSTLNTVQQVSILDNIIKMRLEFEKRIKQEDEINVETRSAMKQAELDLLQKSKKIIALAQSVTVAELCYAIVTDPRLIRDTKKDTRTYQELCEDLLAGGFVYIFPFKYIDENGDLTRLDQSAAEHIQHLPLVTVPLHPGLFRWIEGINTEEEIRAHLAASGIAECPLDFNRLVDHVYNTKNVEDDSNSNNNSGTDAAPQE